MSPLQGGGYYASPEPQEYRTKNAIAQAKHRAKRKLYVEQVRLIVALARCRVSAAD